MPKMHKHFQYTEYTSTVKESNRAGKYNSYNPFHFMNLFLVGALSADAYGSSFVELGPFDAHSDISYP